MKLTYSLLLAGALAGLATEAHAEKFIANFTFREYTVNACGRLAFAIDNTVVEVAECAASVTPPLDPNALVMVYDTVEDEVQVVQKNDGAKICTVFAFSGGTTVSSVDGRRQVRQTFIFVPDHTEAAIGSIAGIIEREFGPRGNLISFEWSASFQTSIPADNEVVIGKLTTSRKFVPGVR